MKRLVVLAVLLASVGDGRADGDGGATPDADEPPTNFPDPTGPDYTIRTPGERTTKTQIILASIAGGGALFTGLGLYFHLDSRSAANDVTATVPTNHPWSAADQKRLDQADSSRTKAIVLYSIGGAALVTAVVYLIITEPAETTTLIHPHRKFVPKVDVSPTGASLGGTWSF